MAVTEAENISQQEALSRAKAGDMDAFCLVVSAHEGRLLGQALALCGDLPSAEDLAQQTWIAAWNSLPRFNGACRFSTWIYAILLHLHYKVLRQKRSRPLPFSSLSTAETQAPDDALLNAPTAEPGPEEVLALKELSRQWREALDHLPDIHREVILLRFFEDASLEEIAAVTGVPINTVKTRLHHALIKMRRIAKSMNLSALGGNP